MKTPSLSDLQKELSEQTPKKVIEVCMRLAKHKKENKELLNYLLFEADNEEAYIKQIKEDTELQFRDMNQSNLYLAKKSLRKILRTTNKFIRYSGSKQTEVELRIHYCATLKESGIPIKNSQVLMNLYNGQVSKIKTAISKLHEDLQFDYSAEVGRLE